MKKLSPRPIALSFGLAVATVKHGDDRLRPAAAPFVPRGFLSVSSRVRSAGAAGRMLVLRALAVVALAAGLAGQTGVAAYDVCTDDYAGQGVLSCAHEQMFDEASRFYSALVVPNRFSEEIIAHAADIRGGVGAPDAGDPLYDNTGAFDALITITHFWQPDQSFGQPQVQGLDPYANAFNAAQGLWMRALGEYAAGNTATAYRFLGMIAHLLGDQTVPAHAHGDTHPENLNDGDPFEEWMSNPQLNKTLLTNAEFDGLVAQGLVDLPDYREHRPASLNRRPNSDDFVPLDRDEGRDTFYDAVTFHRSICNGVVGNQEATG